jgi:hypothetical protein
LSIFPLQTNIQKCDSLNLSTRYIGEVAQLFNSSTLQRFQRFNHPTWRTTVDSPAGALTEITLIDANSCPAIVAALR